MEKTNQEKLHLNHDQCKFVSHVVGAHLSAVDRGKGSLWWDEKKKEHIKSQEVLRTVRTSSSLYPLTKSEDYLCFVSYLLGEYEWLRDDHSEIIHGLFGRPKECALATGLRKILRSARAIAAS